MRIDSEEPLTDGVPAHVAVAGIVAFAFTSSFAGGYSTGTVLVLCKAFRGAPT